MLYSSEFRYELVSGCDSGLFTVKLLHFSPDFDISSRIYFLYIYGGGGVLVTFTKIPFYTQFFFNFLKKWIWNWNEVFEGGGSKTHFLFFF